MKWNLAFVLAIALCLSLAVVVACGDDDDDDDNDDNDDGSYDCADACNVLYECGYAIFVDDVELSEEECVTGCNDEGGVGSCEAACLDAYSDDGDCEAFAECAMNCV